MNTTAEKKRILSMPTVQGELKIHGRTYKFHCIRKENDGISKCVIVELADWCYGITQVHVLTNDTDNVEFWLPGLGKDYLTQLIPYEEIKILYCTYQGIALEQKQDVKIAA